MGHALPLDRELLQRLATEQGLFHANEGAKPPATALTLAPLLALATALEPGMRTLETGCGGSTVVFAAAETGHTVVTPDLAEVERVREFCRDQGISFDRVNCLVGSSDRVLVGWSEPLDLVLIDGAHRLPLPFIDWHYTAPSLRVGGQLFLDDLAIPAVHLLYDFLAGEDEWRAHGIHGDKLAVFEKVAEIPDDPTLDWQLQRFSRKWVYDHIPLRRRWRTWRDRAMLGTRLRRVADRASR